MREEPILIIDNHPANLKLARVLLTRFGYETRTACNAEEALKILVDFEPHLILLDLELPRMSGFEFIRKIKADPKYKNTLIVAVTANVTNGDEEKEKALAAGCDAYVVKPIDIDQLQILLKKMLPAVHKKI